jgi:hypothetical protein
MKRLAAFCSSMPADWMRKTKGAALPSMMGISAASTSTQALSMPRPERADMRCSTVAIRDAVLLQAGGQTGVADGEGVGAQFHRRIEVDAAEDDAGVGRRRTQGHGDLDPGMEPDAGGADQRFQRALLQHDDGAMTKRRSLP